MSLKRNYFLLKGFIKVIKDKLKINLDLHVHENILFYFNNFIFAYIIIYCIYYCINIYIYTLYLKANHIKLCTLKQIFLVFYIAFSRFLNNTYSTSYHLSIFYYIFKNKFYENSKSHNRLQKTKQLIYQLIIMLTLKNMCICNIGINNCVKNIIRRYSDQLSHLKLRVRHFFCWVILYGSCICSLIHATRILKQLANFLNKSLHKLNLH